eukprot:6189809-Pleurochrysis_carterae.AAC.2
MKQKAPACALAATRSKLFRSYTTRCGFRCTHSAEVMSRPLTDACNGGMVYPNLKQAEPEDQDRLMQHAAALARYKI